MASKLLSVGVTVKGIVDVSRMRLVIGAPE
jgi:hypothetical protein